MNILKAPWLLILTICPVAVAQTTTITFDDQSTVFSQPASGNPGFFQVVTTQGFQFVGGGAGGQFLWSLNCTSNAICDGTASLATHIGETTITMSNLAGMPFSLVQFDSAPQFPFTADFSHATQVTVAGTQSGGGTLTATFNLAPSSFTTYTLPATWTTLTSVTFAAIAPICGSSGCWTSLLDNINVTTSGPQTGSISVTTNLASATFSITGPANYTGNGTSFLQTNAPTGSYSITYGAISGYNTPAPQTQTLVPGGTLSFFGTYTPTTGTISVTSTPSGAGFQIAGPGLTYYSGTTPFTASTAPIGDYTITWSTLLGGYFAPPSQTQTLSSGGSILFSGAYTRSGTISVTTNLPNARFNITGPASYSGSGTSFTQAAPIGQYTIAYVAVIGYNTPPMQTQTLTADGTLFFSGTYTVASSQSCRITIDRSSTFGVVDGSVSNTTSPCQFIIHLQNKKPYWTMFTLSYPSGVTVTPVGGNANQYAQYSLLPPAGIVSLPPGTDTAFTMTFTKAGQSVSVFTDPTINTGYYGAAYMNLLQGFVNLTPGANLGVVAIDDYQKVETAFSLMPHLRGAAGGLFSKTPNLATFVTELANFGFSSEPETLWRLFNDIGLTNTIAGLKTLAGVPWRLLNSFVTSFGNIWTFLFQYPSGTIVFTIEQ